VHDEETALQEPAAEAPSEPQEAAPAPFDGADELPAPDTAEAPEEEETPLVPDAREESREALGDTPPGGLESLDDDEPLDEPEESDPDVLEDTPDFLQETPEHDRLWFEQKPPRDFDFD
jgi:hypothetical protein